MVVMTFLVMMFAFMMMFIFVFSATLDRYGLAKYISLWFVSRKCVMGNRAAYLRAAARHRHPGRPDQRHARRPSSAGAFCTA